MKYRTGEHMDCSLVFPNAEILGQLSEITHLYFKKHFFDF